MIEHADTERRSDPAGARKLALKALRLARANNDTLRMARSTTILSFCEYFLANYPMALKRFHEAAILSGNLNDVTIQARINYGLGLTYTRTGEFPQAMEALRHALELVESHNLAELLGHVHNGIAMVFARLSDFPGALEHYRLGLVSFEAIQDSAGESLVLNNLGITYLSLGDVEQAFESFVRSNALAIANNDVSTQAYTMINLGDILHRKGQLDEALQHYTRALEFGRVLGDTHLESITLVAIGAIQILMRDGDLDAAYRFCQQAVEIAARTDDASIWGHIVWVGEVQYARGEYTQALASYNRALEGVRRLGDRFSESQILSRISQCYEAIGDMAEEFRYYKLYTMLKEEVVGQQQQQEMMQFRIRREIEQAEKEREILRLEKQRLEQEMEHNHKELTASALHVVKKNEFLESLKREISEVVRAVDRKARPALQELLRQVDARINDSEDWDAFEKQFMLAHHDFLRKLSQHSPTLTKTELRICALLKLNLTTKEIANILSTSIKTIESHRYHIRKKLDIPLETKLATYMAAF
jgi:tetratricopeptide (TPR) repeat protein